jgi:hypothetical protein
MAVAAFCHAVDVGGMGLGVCGLCSRRTDFEMDRASSKGARHFFM